jgi:hypothetical protein
MKMWCWFIIVLVQVGDHASNGQQSLTDIIEQEVRDAANDTPDVDIIEISRRTYSYLTLCTFSFEIKESSVSNTRYLIQDAISPHCDNNRMARRCTRRSLSNYFDMTSYHWNVRQNTVTWHW